MATRKTTSAEVDKLLQEGPPTAAPSADKLMAITATARELLGQVAKATALEEQLDATNKEVRRLTQEVMVGMLDDAGITELVLAELDLKLKRAEEIYASISAANQSAAAAWLIDNHFGALVKARIVVEAEKEDIAILETTRKALARAHIGYTETSAVHAGTLKAFVKEQLEKGTALPPSITYHVQPVVNVKPLSKPKGAK